MRKFPAEFADLLSRKGRAVLEGRVPELRAALADPRRRILAATGLVDRAQAAACRALLDRGLYEYLSPLSQPIPPETIWAMTEDAGEWLPKTMRMKTAYLARRGRAYRAAESLGLVAMLRSPSFHAFATALAGRALRRRSGVQVLCYGEGDYAGPHNDHHPEQPEAAKGYVDVHISLANPAVAHQFLVYAERGHFSRAIDVNTVGGVTAYRLPLWHYATPLVAKPGREAQARRWVLLGTFLYRDASDARPKAPLT
jgi:hypothetical protein